MNCHAQDVPRMVVMWRQLIATLQPGVVEGRLKRHDGQYRWFLFRADPFRDRFGKVVKWYGTNTDIDDLKRAQVRLSQEEEEARRIIDSIAQAIVVMDTDGRCLYANKVLLEYAGLSLDDVQPPD